MTQVIRTALRVEGIVQGVGFRPFVYSLATGLGLGGLVGNDVDGVFAEVEGPPAAVREFLRRAGAGGAAAGAGRAGHRVRHAAGGHGLLHDRRRASPPAGAGP